MTVFCALIAEEKHRFQHLGYSFESRVFSGHTEGLEEQSLVGKGLEVLVQKQRQVRAPRFVCSCLRTPLADPTPPPARSQPPLGAAHVEFCEGTEAGDPPTEPGTSR